MTCTGQYRPMNRAGMVGGSSPFLQMSFESTVRSARARALDLGAAKGRRALPAHTLTTSLAAQATFLTAAAVSDATDQLESPSARIVLGKPPRVGTGAFDLRVPVDPM